MVSHITSAHNSPQHWKRYTVLGLLERKGYLSGVFFFKYNFNLAGGENDDSGCGDIRCVLAAFSCLLCGDVILP